MDFLQISTSTSMQYDITIHHEKVLKDKKFKTIFGTLMTFKKETMYTDINTKFEASKKICKKNKIRVIFPQKMF